jgi:predicted transcriptional regulator
MSLHIPALRNVSELAKSLNLREDTVRNALDFLLQAQLVDGGEQGLVPTKRNFHLNSDAPSIHKHHSHWRLKALQSLEQKQDQEIHYTSLISISHDDVGKVQEILIKAIQDIRSLVKKSTPEELVYCYLVDLFPVSFRKD